MRSDFFEGRPKGFMKKAVSTPVKIIIFTLYALSCLAILAIIAFNVKAIATAIAGTSLGWIVGWVYAHELIIETVSFIVMIICGIKILGLAFVKFFPSKVTLVTTIYNTIVFILIDFLIKSFATYNSYFPYPVLFIIPVLTFIFTTIFFIDDIVRLGPVDSIKTRESEISRVAEYQPQSSSMIATDDAFEEEEEKPAVTVPEKDEDEAFFEKFEEDSFSEESLADDMAPVVDAFLAPEVKVTPMEQPATTVDDPFADFADYIEEE